MVKRIFTHIKHVSNRFFLFTGEARGLSSRKETFPTRKYINTFCNTSVDSNFSSIQSPSENTDLNARVVANNQNSNLSLLTN